MFDWPPPPRVGESPATPGPRFHSLPPASKRTSRRGGLRLRAVQELAIIGSAPEHLYPLLQHFATSKRRLFDGSGPLSGVEMDERLRYAARLLVDAAAH